jgi:hypothetical protein
MGLRPLCVVVPGCSTQSSGSSNKLVNSSDAFLLLAGVERGGNSISARDKAVKIFLVLLSYPIKLHVDTLLPFSSYFVTLSRHFDGFSKNKDVYPMFHICETRLSRVLCFMYPSAALVCLPLLLLISLLPR